MLRFVSLRCETVTSQGPSWDLYKVDATWDRVYKMSVQNLWASDLQDLFVFCVAGFTADMQGRIMAALQ